MFPRTPFKQCELQVEDLGPQQRQGATNNTSKGGVHGLVLQSNIYNVFHVILLHGALKDLPLLIRFCSYSYAEKLCVLGAQSIILIHHEEIYVCVETG